MITENDVKIMKEAVDLSKCCTISQSAYSVGAIIVDKNYKIISVGCSREEGGNFHAEEVAISKAISDGIDLSEATIYSTMEPCGYRLSGKECCANLIIKAGIKKVVYGIKEPPYFVKQTSGIHKLLSNGIEVQQVKDVMNEVLSINKHIGEKIQP